MPWDKTYVGHRTVSSPLLNTKYLISVTQKRSRRKRDYSLYHNTERFVAVTAVALCFASQNSQNCVASVIRATVSVTSSGEPWNFKGKHIIEKNTVIPNA